MVIVSDVMPTLKSFLRPVRLSDAARLMVVRIVTAFILHSGRMSCLAAADAVRNQHRPRAQVGRFLERPRWKKARLLHNLGLSLISKEPSPEDTWLFIVDSTLHGQSGKKTQNAYHTGNKTRRGRKKGKRYNENKHALRRCHHFVCGLLISPSGTLGVFTVDAIQTLTSMTSSVPKKESTAIGCAFRFTGRFTRGTIAGRKAWCIARSPNWLRT